MKERVATQTITARSGGEGPTLDKDKVEKHLGRAIGESSWTILSVIFENPSISNREIAEQVFLSVEGVSSSLRRMYKAFDVQSENKQNMKVALLTKIVKISLDP